MNDGHNIRLEQDDPTDSHYVQLDIPRHPIATQIKPFSEPQVHWGVHFLHEDVISNYGPGEGAKLAAEAWVNSMPEDVRDQLVEVVSSVVYPWRAANKERLKLAREIRGLGNSVLSVKALRTWLFKQNFDEESPRKSNLQTQILIMRQMVRAVDDAAAAEFLYRWLIENGYEL